MVNRSRHRVQLSRDACEYYHSANAVSLSNYYGLGSNVDLSLSDANGDQKNVHADNVVRLLSELRERGVTASRYATPNALSARIREVMHQMFPNRPTQTQLKPRRQRQRTKVQHKAESADLS